MAVCIIMMQKPGHIPISKKHMDFLPMFVPSKETYLCNNM
jgi:hypothetical protein